MSGSSQQNPIDLAGGVASAPRVVPRLRFGVFEIDLENRELRKRGLRLRIQQKPFQILQRLLATPGKLVTRAELARLLWPGLHVNFDRSLNTAVNALRRVLGDPSRNPRFVETRAGSGYSFIAPVEPIGEPDDAIAAKVYTNNSDAHQDYLKGRYFLNKMSEDDLRRSVAYFEAALAAEPDSALAYAGLADAYQAFAFLGALPAAEAHARAREFALAALRIDDNLAEAHASLAGVKKLSDWDWRGAEDSYLRALELNPNYARGHHLYAEHLSALGRSREAIEQIRLALALDPLSLVVNMELAWNLYMARDFSAALEQSWKTLALEARFAPAQHTLGLAYEQMGLSEEAIVEFQNARTCSDGHPSTVAALGHALAADGRRGQAVELLEELRQTSKSRRVSPYWLSILHAGLGDRDLALESLEQAHRERDVWLVWLKVEPRFDSLRADSRFQALLRGIRLPA